MPIRIVRDGEVEAVGGVSRVSWKKADLTLRRFLDMALMLLLFGESTLDEFYLLSVIIEPILEISSRWDITSDLSSSWRLEGPLTPLILNGSNVSMHTRGLGFALWLISDFDASECLEDCKETFEFTLGRRFNAELLVNLSRDGDKILS